MNATTNKTDLTPMLITVPKAVCIITNCGRTAPDGEAFCSHHRDNPMSPVDEACATMDRAIEQIEGLRSDLLRSRLVSSQLYEALKDQEWFLTHYLDQLEYRQTTPDPKANGFAFAAVPEWALRQRQDSARQAIAAATGEKK